MTTEAIETAAELQAIIALRAYNAVSAQIKPLEATKTDYGKQLKAWLIASVFCVLVDPETGASAMLQERQGQPELDLAQASDAEVLTLARAGLLRAVAQTAATAINATNSRAAATWKKYAMPGPVTYTLVPKEGAK